ncbi:MAG: hypothetical protein ABIK28_10105 [Planctomycetota bacterium]
MNSIRTILYLLLSLGSFFLVSHAVKQLVPWPDDGDLRVKRDYFRAHKEEYNSLFFGSSKVFRAVVPDLIEKELARHDLPMHSFNFGCPSMYTFETDFFVKEILRLGPKHLEWVFLEWVNWNPNIQDEDLYTVRTVHWHSTEETWLALDAVLHGDRRFFDKVGLAIDHVGHWIWKQVSYGRGIDTVSYMLDRLKDPGDAPYVGDTAYIPEMHGYHALEDELHLPGITKRRSYFVANQDRYHDMIKNLRQRNRRTSAAAGIHLKSLARQVDAIRAVGAEPFFFDIPGELETPAPIPYLKDEKIRALIGYNRLRVFPDFFDPKNRFDSNHFSREGAECFTRAFASDFAALIEKGGDS